jgi:hypothetical protein
LLDSERDSGAVRLASVYAEAIDADPSQLAKLGPLLQSALETLGLTPKARAALTGRGGGPGGAAQSELDKHRERRRARRDGA